MEAGNKLRISSFNCNSLRKHVDVVRAVMNECDVLACQEIILLPDDIYLLDMIDENFMFVAVPSKTPNSDTFDGRPSGGLVIFWRKSLDISVEVVAESDHFQVVIMRIGNEIFCVSKIYMPYDNKAADSVVNYSFILAELQVVLDSINTNNLLCLGDFNADPNKGRLWPLLIDFTQQNDLKNFNDNLPTDSFTYLRGLLQFLGKKIIIEDRNLKVSI